MRFPKMEIRDTFVKAWAAGVVLVGMFVAGALAGVALNVQPDAGPEYDPVGLYCLAIADTGAQAGALQDRKAYFGFVENCMEKLLKEGTVWDFPMEYGAEYVRSIYQTPLSGGSGPAPLPR